MKMLRKYWWIIAGPFIIIVLVATVLRIGVPGFGQSTREVCEASSQQTSPSSSKLILYNGIILTMDDAQPQAQAIAIKGDRIVAVGSNEEILPRKSLTWRGKPSCPASSILTSTASAINKASLGSRRA